MLIWGDENQQNPNSDTGSIFDTSGSLPHQVDPNSIDNWLGGKAADVGGAALHKAAQGVGAVSDLANQFARLKNFAWGGLVEARRGGSALEGMYNGLINNQDYNPLDVIGFKHPDENMSWPEWAGRTGSMAAANMLLDPLNGLGLLAKSPKVIEAVQPLIQAKNKFKDVVAGSPLGRLDMQRLPTGVINNGVNYDNLMADMDRIKYGNSAYSLDKRAQETRDATNAAIAKLPPEVAGNVDELALFDAVERRGVPIQGGIHPDLNPVVDAIEPFRQEKLALHDTRRDLTGDLGFPVPAKISEADINYMPQLMRPEFARLKGKGQNANYGGVPLDINPSEQASRDIFNWVDFNNNPVRIGKLTDPRTQVEHVIPEPDSLARPDVFRDTQTGQRLFQQQAPLRDKLEILNPDQMVSNPIDALHMAMESERKKVNYLQTLKNFRDQGALRPLDDANPLIPGWIKSTVPGFEGQLPKAVHNLLMNETKANFNPDVSLGWLPDLLHKVVESKPGRWLNDETTLWKNTTLPLHPSYQAGNAVSNIPQQYLSGLSPWQILKNDTQAVGVQRGKGTDVFPGITNTALQEELGPRGVLQTGLSPELQVRSSGYGSHIRNAANNLSDLAGEYAPSLQNAVDTVGGLATKAGELGARATNWGWRVGGNIEGNAKTGVAIDWLKKNQPDFATLPEAQRARVLDKAARFAHDALIDYAGGTPFEKDMKLLFPFFPWMRGITGRTAELAVTHPERFARLNYGLNAMLQPLDERDKAVADPWINKGMPIKGALGIPFGKGPNGNPNIAMVNRFLPFGDVEELARSPLNYLGSRFNPAIRAPMELAANYDTNMDRQIDPETSGPFSSLIAPFRGKNFTYARHKLFGSDIPAGFEYLLGMVPGARYLSELRNIGSGSGLTPDPYRQKMDPSELAAQYGIGGKFFEFDRNRQLLSRNWEYKKQIEQIRQNMTQAAKKGDASQVKEYTNQLQNTYKALGEFMKNAQ